MNGWISVNDRLPEDGTEVLICTLSKSGNRNIDKGYYIESDGRWAHRGTAAVTHWQPLPQLPGQKKTRREKIIERIVNFDNDEFDEFVDLVCRKFCPDGVVCGDIAQYCTCYDCWRGYLTETEEEERDR